MSLITEQEGRTAQEKPDPKTAGKGRRGSGHAGERGTE